MLPDRNQAVQPEQSPVGVGCCGKTGTSAFREYQNLNPPRDHPGKFTVIYNKRRFFILIFTCQGFECAFVRDLRVYLAAGMW
jgi:hypothetical protein